MSDIPSRPYRQVARAAATERTQTRIVEVFFAMLRAKWLDEITLDAVAAEAETTRQTVIRLVGGKDKLIAAASILAREQITGRRQLPPEPTPAQVAEILIADYEVDGDMLIRMLALESRHPELSILLDGGRQYHRDWVAGAFAAALAHHSGEQRERLLDELVACTDLYLWKLFRRDLGRDRASVVRQTASMLDKVLRGTPA